MKKDSSEVIGSEIKDCEFILKTLRENSDPQEAFAKFRTIMSSIPYGNDLSLKLDEIQGRGRASYIAQIYKINWNGSNMRKGKNNKWILSKDSYNIHFEIAFEMLSNSLKMSLHYEVNPYYPKRWIEKNVDADSYQKYLELREKVYHDFENIILESKINYLKASKCSNQILKIKFDIFENTTIKEFKKKIVSIVDIVSDMVDKVLAKSNEYSND